MTANGEHPFNPTHWKAMADETERNTIDFDHEYR